MFSSLAALAFSALAAPQDALELFREDVAPLLEERCFPCHDGEQSKGDLSFEASELREDLITPGDPEGSLLLEVVSGADPEMPKGADPLTEDELGVLRDWVEAGGVWVDGEVGSRRWWSLQPLKHVTPPHPPALSLTEEAAWQDWMQDPLDAFILKELRARGLKPSPEANPRTLLRRLHFDLVGLPPTPEELKAFLTDKSPDAYEHEVDRLLASPRYGERWARHWLDVVHYADTHGYDKDKTRPNAWPYRDWVIRALNEDKPYADFVAEQLAGDVLYEDDPSAVVATGMLAAGPWDYVGHVELREGTVDKKKTRNLDRDDVVTNVFSSFQSLTVHCARCHDHKFDPITQAEYYDLQSVFAGIERAEREYDADPEIGALRAALVGERDALQDSLREAKELLDQMVERDARPSSIELRGARAEAQASITQPDRTGSMGYHTEMSYTADAPKWVQVDLGADSELEEVIIYPCDEVFGGHPGPGFGLPAELKLQVASTPEGEWSTAGTWRKADAGIRHGDRPIRFDLANGTSARYVRVHVPVLWERTEDYCFALAELEVLASGENIARGATVEAKDSIEAGGRWGKELLVDGVRPWTPEMARIEELEEDWRALRAELEPESARTVRERDSEQLTVVSSELSALPPSSKVYAAATSFQREGSFTPPPGGAPRAVYRLERGDVTQPLEASAPGAVSALPHAPASFGLPEESDESARRVALAEWITHPDNPLTWRSIVNRVWQFHFGRGLVDSPNDFGRMGTKPSHPELLDHLALRFRDGGGSLKDLHRALVLSATYRQSSAHQPFAAAVDSGNRFLWRANRRRLEAEALRDATLSVSGDLNLEMGGPGFQLFGFEDDHSPRYLYAEADLEDAGSHRRSVYRFVVRSVPDPWMTTFDCADPSQCTPVRSETTTPLQALALLNDRFMLRQAERFAARVKAEAPRNPITLAARLAWQRELDYAEELLLREHASEHGLAAVCRALLNSNEFLYVD